MDASASQRSIHHQCDVFTLECFIDSRCTSSYLHFPYNKFDARDLEFTLETSPSQLATIAMHPSALRNADRFFKIYSPYKQASSVRLVDIGSQGINGSIRQVCPPNIEYVGVDFVQGKGVDVVLDDPYVLPFASNDFDIIVTSSCFEHSEMFWLLFLELLRIAKPDGLIYLNAPSNAAFHRYPVDCWRFYPDSGHALANWGRRNGYRCGLLESYISDQGDDGLVNDFVAVVIKDAELARKYPDRITRTIANFTNGFNDLDSGILRLEPETEDHRNLLRNRLKALRRRAKSGVKRLLRP